MLYYLTVLALLKQLSVSVGGHASGGYLPRGSVNTHH